MSAGSQAFSATEADGLVTLRHELHQASEISG